MYVHIISYKRIADFYVYKCDVDIVNNNVIRDDSIVLLRPDNARNICLVNFLHVFTFPSDSEIHIFAMEKR